MARVFIDGFETGLAHPHNLWDYAVGWANAGYITTNPSTYGMSGNYCLRVGHEDGWGHIFRADDYTSDLYFSYRIYSTQDIAPRMTLQNSSLAEILHIYINTDYGDSLVHARVGGSTVYAGTIAMRKNQPYRIEFRYRPHATNGVIQVKVNGVLDIDKVGVNTVGSRSPSVDRFYFDGVGDWGYIDDIIVDDAQWVGNTRIQAITPSADVTCAWVAVPATNHYANVNEIPWVPDSTDTAYVYTDTTGKIDLFACTNLVDSTAQPIVSIRSVQISARAKLAGDATNVPRLRLGVQPAGSGTIYYGGYHQVEQDNWKSFNSIWSTNPAGGNWDMTTINNMNIAIRSEP